MSNFALKPFMRIKSIGDNPRINPRINLHSLIISCKIYFSTALAMLLFHVEIM